MNCWQCGAEIAEVSAARKVLRNDSCPRCNSDLHVCKNCTHYDPQYHNDCWETQAEWVNDKERANFCDYFSPATASKSPTGGSSSDQAKSAFDKLLETRALARQYGRLSALRFNHSPESFHHHAKFACPE